VRDIASAHHEFFHGGLQNWQVPLDHLPDNLEVNPK
jgi:hypothetical protein